MAEEAALEREVFWMFTPTLNMPAYELHRWKVRGTTVADVLDIERFRPSQFAFVAGRVEPVPPQELIDRVDHLLANGAEVDAPYGWRASLAILNSAVSATASATKEGA